MSAVQIEIEEGEDFSLLRLGAFAPSHAHAFVVRGLAGRTLFRNGAVPREEICRSAGLDGATLCLAKQVHGANVVDVPAAATGSADATGTAMQRRAALAGLPDAGPPPEADALVSRHGGCAVGVATADCLPILIASSQGACAAVHAGWRGLLAGVIEAAVATLRGGPVGIGARPGSLPSQPPGTGGTPAWPDPAPGQALAGDGGDTGGGEHRMEPAVSLSAAIGPAIGPCCFEVDEELASRFRARFPGVESFVRPGLRPAKSMVDLGAAATRALVEAGVAAGNVQAAGLCTRCGGPRFESYRRDGAAAGRMIALIAPHRS